MRGCNIARRHCLMSEAEVCNNLRRRSLMTPALMYYSTWALLIGSGAEVIFQAGTPSCNGRRTSLQLRNHLTAHTCIRYVRRACFCLSGVSGVCMVCLECLLGVFVDEDCVCFGEAVL